MEEEQLAQTKLISSAVLFLMTFVCGYLPVRMILRPKYVQLAIYAGGGVLMATAFCHLIPELIDSYRASYLQSAHNHQHHHHEHHHEHLVQNNNNNNISQPPVESFTSHSSTESIQHVQDPTEPTQQTNNTTLFDQASLVEPFAVLPTENSLDDGQQANITTTMAPQPTTTLEPPPTVRPYVIPYLEITLCAGFFFMYLVEAAMVRFVNNHTHEHPCDTGFNENISNVVTSSTLSTNQFVTSSSARGELYKFIRGLLIVSAFAAHAVFDGVAIGSQDSSTKVWTVFVAISCHKLIIAAVVGLELFAATLESHLWTLVHVGLFSAMSPVGIVLVVVAQSSLQIDSSHPTMILLQAFATGTLLYIIFVEILQPKEGHDYEKNKLAKGFSLIGGFALMVCVLVFLGDAH